MAITRTEAAAPAGVVRRSRLTAREIAERWSLVLAFVAAFAFFAVERPHTFLTWDNVRSILDDSSVLSVLAVGVTAVLVIGEFDLSVGFVVGLSAATGVSVMVFHGLSAPVAVVTAIGTGGIAGVANGIAVAVVRIPSFIATLALGSIAGAIELAVTKTSIFERLDPSYQNLAVTSVEPIPLRAIIAAAIVLLFLVILRTTVYGRHASSVGDNPSAARLAGGPGGGVAGIAFVLAGLTAGLAGGVGTSSARGD